jgi:hypothetical protein
MSSFVKNPGLSQDELQSVAKGSKSNNNSQQETTKESEFRGYILGKQHNFIAMNGRSSIKIGVMMSKEGWKLSLFDDPDDNQPERKALIVNTPLEAAQRFIDTKYVGLELQPC